MRLNITENIEVCNKETEENFLCKIIKIEQNKINTEIIEKINNSKETSIELHIFQGLPKAEKMETIIQKATEIGVVEITPVIMKRSVVKLDEKTAIKKTERWQKIAEVSAKQSKRDRIPKINYPILMKNLYEKIQNCDIVLVAYENEEKNNIKKALKKIEKKRNFKIAIIIGPEGGIDETEIEYLKNTKAQIISLGKRILRTETAPIVLSSIIMYEFDEM